MMSLYMPSSASPVEGRVPTEILVYLVNHTASPTPMRSPRSGAPYTMLSPVAL